MRTQLFSLAVAIIARTASAHYVFANLVVNGTVSGRWKYVRDVATEPKFTGLEYGKIMPLYDLDSPDMICGRSANVSGVKTSVADVAAGGEIAFVVSDILEIEDTFYHAGPGMAYMSKAPNDDVEHYDGKGDWFKVAEYGPASDTAFKLDGLSRLKVTIPKATPPGKYLVRAEHIYLSDQIKQSQFYINCAQINVIGPGGGKPLPVIRFPSAYNYSDPSIFITTAQYHHQDLLKYKAPGPPVWQG